MGGSLGIESLGDNYVAMRYRDNECGGQPGGDELVAVDGPRAGAGLHQPGGGGNQPL